MAKEKKGGMLIYLGRPIEIAYRNDGMAIGQPCVSIVFSKKGVGDEIQLGVMADDVQSYLKEINHNLVCISGITSNNQANVVAAMGAIYRLSPQVAYEVDWDISITPRSEFWPLVDIWTLRLTAKLKSTDAKFVQDAKSGGSIGHIVAVIKRPEDMSEVCQWCDDNGVSRKSFIIQVEGQPSRSFMTEISKLGFRIQQPIVLE